MSRVLLVSPAFHGYWRSIGSALERRGHEVRAHAYDRLPSAAAKARHQLGYELPARVGLDRTTAQRRATTEKTLAVLREQPVDAVVVVRGDALADDFWEELDRRRLPRVTWIYDELARMGYSEQRLLSMGPVASYSPGDTASLLALGVPARHLPDAYDHTLEVPRLHGHDQQVVFVGARYGRREHDLRAVQEAGVPVLAVGRDWSRHPWDRARTWSWQRPPLPAWRDVGLTTAFGLQAAAAAALNVHDRQDGFTMRTYEIPGVGGVQLIDRPDVETLYDPGTEVVVYRDEAELVEAARRAVADREWSDAIRRNGRRRTLAEHTFDHRVAVLEEMWASWD